MLKGRFIFIPVKRKERLKIFLHLRRIVVPLFFYFLLGCATGIWQEVDLAKRQKNPEAAIEILQNYLRTQPNSARAYYQLGEIYAEQERWEEMNAAFASCEQLDERWQRETGSTRQFYFARYMNNGLAATQQQNFSQAINEYESALKILPENADAYRMLGRAYMETGDTLNARKALQKTLEIAPENQFARQRLMMLHFLGGRDEQALTEARTLQKELPYDESVLRIIAYSLDRLNEQEAAESAYRALLEISVDPDDLESFAAFHYRQGDYEEAIALSRQAILRGGDRVSNLKAIAQVHLMQQNFPELINTANEILEIAPDDLVALQLLQTAHAARGDVETVKMITHRIKEIEANLQ